MYQIPTNIIQHKYKLYLYIKNIITETRKDLNTQWRTFNLALGGRWVSKNNRYLFFRCTDK
jgi:hypothetical protein